jgi:hypothetical protein
MTGTAAVMIASTPRPAANPIPPGAFFDHMVHVGWINKKMREKTENSFKPSKPTGIQVITNQNHLYCTMDISSSDARCVQ